MPALNRLLGAGGTRMSNFVVPTGLCCPARTSLLTGKLAHCTNVTTNYYPSGGFVRFYQQQLDRNWLPVWLRAAGYNTGLVGKFLNQYLETYAPSGYAPAGFTHFEALTVNAYNMTNSCFSLSGAASTCYPGEYQTELIMTKALDYIGSYAAANAPFLLYVAPTAPHRSSTDGILWYPPTPAKQYANLYSASENQVPRGLNWDFRNRNLPRRGAVAVDATFEAFMDSLYLYRLRALRSVDDLIGSIVGKLQRLGVLNNTYVIFTSDNGYHMGAFSLLDGKNLPIEEDVRVPFFIRGPGIPAGQVLPYQANLVDLAPTILALAGLALPGHLDGLPMPLNPQLAAAHTQVLLASVAPAPEASGQTEGGSVAAAGSEKAAWGGPMLRDTTILEGWEGDAAARTNFTVDVVANLSAHYKALRLCTDTKLLQPSPRDAQTAAGDPNLFSARYVLDPGVTCYKYTVWCQGNRELYDLAADPYELSNRITTAPLRIANRLDAVLSALVHCSGASCRNPYSLLHPGGGVWNFSGTLPSQYDPMYRGLSKLRILRCRSSYDPANELTWTQTAVAGTGTSG
ncbi:hypothetical protein CHLRE_01g012126v5 [Chlamydomonas reinhardtii]|uniref:Sulfatase N-terminal domain-containing protein n=1 Tax=Chlamydomonas reinhardtii TaxID=3055 RepID=A0A2K3E5I2_CHLRE|nr:uncharacterized protein CHLRE_01g012126v5 [Chlamydomonas reinhardtii]PNW88050.1 hypothetical protein CHLRE_01g012126v5 [Chlamydomonas reinhardtii]